MLQPVGDKVIVKRIERKAITEGGIHLPEAAQELPTEAIVVAIGPGRVTDTGVVVPMSVAVGDRVIVPQWGNEFTHEGEKLLAVSDETILAVYDGQG